MKPGVPDFGALTKVYDGTRVQVVGNDVEKAIRTLHKRIGEAGTLRLLQVRRSYPSVQSRKRRKMAAAAERCRHAEQKKRAKR